MYVLLHSFYICILNWMHMHPPFLSSFPVFRVFWRLTG